MFLLWPGFLTLLVSIPLLAAVYWWVKRRKRRIALRYSSLALIRPALPKRSRLRSYLPPALFLFALASLVVSLGRPIYINRKTAELTTIILAVDVSASMLYDDVPPSRLFAAQSAALSFIHHQKENARIGIVDFTGFSEIVLPPTTDQNTLEVAIESLTTGKATAIGDGILTSLEAIALVNPAKEKGKKTGGRMDSPQKDQDPSEIIVLLTDGVSNMGHSPLEAAQIAAQRGVRIYTIGFGTLQGPSMPDDHSKVQQLSIPNTGNNLSMRGIDEATLQDIAETTGGKYYAAESAIELEKVYAKLLPRPASHQNTQEISVIFAALGALLAATSMTLALIWHPLP